MNANRDKFPVKRLKTVRIYKPVPEFQQVELNFLDFMCIKKFSCHTLFFNYRVDGGRLTAALRNWSDEYLECAARIAPHADHVYQLVFEEDLWFPLIIQETPRSSRDAFRIEGRWLGSVRNYPAMRELPFFMEDICLKCMMKGESPLVKMKLTYYGDGTSSLGVTCCHGITDGHGVMMALEDLSSLMRGEEVPPRDHNRSMLWPDSFLRTLDICPALRSIPMPRSVSEDFSLGRYELKSLPEEHVALELLFIPDSAVKKSIERLEKVLPGDVVVTNEVFLTALIWLMRGEMDWKTDEAIKSCKMPDDLECRKDLLKGSHCTVFRNLSDMTPPLISRDYFGNTWEMPFMTYQDTHNTAAASQLMHVMANACLSVHAGCQAGNNADGIAENLISVYNAANNQSMYTDFTLNMKCSVVHLKTPPPCDFGHGPAAFQYILPSVPVFYHMFMCYYDVLRQGHVISFLVIPAHKRIMQSSEVLRKFAPGSVQLLDEALSPPDRRRVALW